MNEHQKDAVKRGRARKSDIPCTMCGTLNDVYEHIPWIHGLTFENQKQKGYPLMTTCWKCFGEVWAGEN